MEGKDQGSLVVCLQKPEIGYNLGLSQYKIRVSNWGQAQQFWGQAQYTGDKPKG